MIDALVAAAVTIGAATQQSAPQGYYLTLVAPVTTSPSQLVARAILPGETTCPPLEVVGPTGPQSLPMSVRKPGASTGKAFKGVLACSANIPEGATSASIDGHSIPAAMADQIESVAAMSDTGCRVAPRWQNCHSAKAWPLRRMAKDIAARKPDLILHVGDFYYREEACPKRLHKWCGGSPKPPKGKPFFDTARGWIVDFFEPTQAMNSVAPLLAGRGNHESCDKAGNGYFIYLDVSDLGPAACAPVKGKAPRNTEQPWFMDMPTVAGQTVRLIVVDSADAEDDFISSWARRQRPKFEAAQNMAAAPGVQPFLLTHRPVLGLTTKKIRAVPLKKWTPWISMDQTAASYGLLDHYRGILSGHMHMSQVVQVPDLPPQITAGGGGTALDPAKGWVKPKYGALANAKGKPMRKKYTPYPKLGHRWQKIAWAYQWVEPLGDAGNWRFRFISPQGKTIIRCDVAASASCKR